MTVRAVSHLLGTHQGGQLYNTVASPPPLFLASPPRCLSSLVCVAPVHVSLVHVLTGVCSCLCRSHLCSLTYTMLALGISLIVY